MANRKALPIILTSRETARMPPISLLLVLFTALTFCFMCTQAPESLSQYCMSFPPWVLWWLSYLPPSYLWYVSLLEILALRPCIFNPLVKFVSAHLGAAKLQRVLQLEPQLEPSFYQGPADLASGECALADPALRPRSQSWAVTAPDRLAALRAPFLMGECE